ncbi:MAG: type I restriction endonuclease subunit R [Kiritimatiellae bacterium]|nr:type I restriction endonuclease subunit R [Kiritimatiellia bacterium]
MEYDKLAECPEFTVVNEYLPEIEVGSGAYESEAQLEKRFIQTLESQGYEYLNTLTQEADLIDNLRRQMEKLNREELKGGTFTDKEWARFYSEILANPKDHVVEKTKKFQEERRFDFTFDDGHHDNLMIVDVEHPGKNTLQVINQYEELGGEHEVRYDVTVLMNGLPVVHIELKKRGVAIREAFNQIKRYSRDGFWAGAALFEWVQIFVISNGTETKYYANTTRDNHLREMANAATKGGKKTSNSFEFTSWWADARNNPITDLRDFAKTFFAQRTLRNILTRFCVFTEEEVLMVMRPYQIAATERILERIRYASNNPKTLGTVTAGGYVWHSTGSGKTLTSFKTAQLATKLDYIDRVLFVVDRQDLDNQTQREYNRFQKDCVKGTVDTAALTAQLSDAITCDKNGKPVQKSKIVITTIQKLSIFVNNNAPGSEHAGIYQKHVVIIFDECHRSQFGKMHAEIAKKFKKYHIFGFTGTPIFAKNAGASGNPNMRTTEQAFGAQLHQYTIVDAIRDQNVLPFHVETIGKVSPKENIQDKNVKSIDVESALLKPERVTEVVKYILSHFDDKTLRAKSYMLKGEQVKGFNSIFCVSSVKAAMAYYDEFKRQLEALPEDHPAKGLKIATIFTYSQNEDDPEDGDLDGGGDVTKLDQTSRQFLEGAIQDYNGLFPKSGKSAFGAGNGDQFHNYYMDISEKMKTRRLDLLIVVNMFLTGFDATTLNTLWVDKNLKLHGLLQAFSRTNRILNSVKTCGNVICFRNLEDQTNEAISLFGDKNAAGIVKIRTFAEYYSTGYADGNGRKVKSYVELIHELTAEYPLDTVIIGEAAIKGFVVLFGELLRRLNILRVFDEFSEDRAAKQILTDLQLQDYKSWYLDFYDRLRGKEKGERENINDDIVFEMDTIRQFDVNIDYILSMVDQYHGANCQDKELLGKIRKALDASPSLRPKRTLIHAFIHAYNSSNGQVNWAAFVIEKLGKDVQALAEKHGMDAEKTYTYLTNSLGIGALATSGEDFNNILPAMSMFATDDAATAYAEKTAAISADLQLLFDEYKGVYVDLIDSYSATPAECWKSGKPGVPSPVPPGYCAYLVMMSEYYDAIESGEKRMEYRTVNPKYIPMFRHKKPVAVRLAYGYTTRQMTWEVVGVEENGGSFEIELGKRLA